jgi:hypothetical protein
MLDLPTFERPITAISAPSSAGRPAVSGVLNANRADLK